MREREVAASSPRGVHPQAMVRHRSPDAVLQELIDSGAPMDKLVAFMKSKGMAAKKMVDILSRQGYSTNAITNALYDAGLLIPEITKALKLAGKSGPEVAKALDSLNGNLNFVLRRKGKRMDSQEIACLMKNAGFSAGDIVESLKDLRLKAPEILKALKLAGFPKRTIAEAMKYAPKADNPFAESATMTWSKHQYSLKERFLKDGALSR